MGSWRSIWRKGENQDKPSKERKRWWTRFIRLSNDARAPHVNPYPHLFHKHKNSSNLKEQKKLANASHQTDQCYSATPTVKMSKRIHSPKEKTQETKNQAKLNLSYLAEHLLFRSPKCGVHWNCLKYRGAT